MDDKQDWSNEHDVVAREALERRRVGEKPFIDHLEDAVKTADDGSIEFLLGVGERLVIERYSVLSNKTPKPWLDTRTYVIEHVDPLSGDLKLRDDEVNNKALSNFKTGLVHGFKFKVPVGSRLKNKKTQKFLREVEEKGLEAAVKERAEAPKREASKEVARKIYDVKGKLCTRIKGSLFVPQQPTRASSADSLVFTFITGEKATARHPSAGWTETWIKEG